MSSPLHIPAADNPRLGIALMVVSTVLFAILWAFVKALSSRYSVYEVSFFRNLFALIPVSVMVATHGGRKLFKVQRITGHIWRSFIGVTAMVLGFWSYALLPLADAVALSFAAPLVVTALSVPLLHERVGIVRWSAVIVGFAGVLVIVQPGAGMLSLGALVAAAAAFAVALATLTVRQLNRTDPSITIVFYFTTFSTILTALPLPFVWQMPTLVDWGWFVTSGIVGGIGQYFMTRALGLAPAAVVSPFNYAGLLWATLFGWLVWDDLPAPHVVAGAAIVVASGLFILYRETRKAAAHGPAVAEAAGREPVERV